MKRVLFIVVCIILFFGLLYGLLLFLSRTTYPVLFGISFNQDHAQSLGLDWKETYSAMLKDLKPQYIRIAAMWSDVEKEQGKFDFSSVDWMMDEAKKHNAKVLLVVGQKAPRWPECHVPGWADPTKVEFTEQLTTYITKVVERYKTHDALELWQVENEPFIRFKFGACEKYHSAFTDDEVELVKGIDPLHKIVVTDSGELSTWRKASGLGDIFGSTMYRIVRTPGGHIIRYDWLPAAVYRLKARLWGVGYETYFVSELQAEPWFTASLPLDTPLTEQYETMSIDRLRDHLEFVHHTGASRAYLWGVEWWYWLKKEKKEVQYWETVKEVIEKSKELTKGQY
ncbi:MAG TPA: beta-galactosidase [Candidatus Kapabacteria bacterium]|nr:beta-galactosidase [Candidatus Kapabacteria bacterium]